MCVDRLHNAGGGLITLIRDNITFTITNIHSTINTHNTELQMVKVHIYLPTHHHHNQHMYTDKNRPTFTNYKKPTGHNSRKTQSPPTIIPSYPPTYTLPTYFLQTSSWWQTDRHTTSKGNMHSSCRLLPDHIVCKITQR